jgi:hypothetical protein
MILHRRKWAVRYHSQHLLAVLAATWAPILTAGSDLKRKQSAILLKDYSDIIPALTWREELVSYLIEEMKYYPKYVIDKTQDAVEHFSSIGGTDDDDANFLFSPSKPNNEQCQRTEVDGDLGESNYGWQSNKLKTVSLHKVYLRDATFVPELVLACISSVERSALRLSPIYLWFEEVTTLEAVLPDLGIWSQPREVHQEVL